MPADADPRSRSRPLALVGPRGTGKSTIGRLLATRLRSPFVDLDDDVEAMAGRTIAAIFSDDGESTFRDLEERVLASAVRSGGVIATGGGVVLRAANRDALRRCWTVRLAATPETLVARITGDERSTSRRPSLTSLPLEDEVRTLMADRDLLYAEVADLTVQTDEFPTADAIAAMLVEAYRESSDSRVAHYADDERHAEGAS